MLGCRLQRDAKVADLQLMLDERPASFAVLAAPFELRGSVFVARCKEARATIGERICDRRRTGCWVVVELRARPVEVAGVEETT